MITHKVLDAAFPPMTLPPSVDGVAGYVGGRATHTWTLAEWLRFEHVPQFPIWAADIGEAPALEAGTAVEAMLHRGWAPHMPEPGQRALFVDLETSIAPKWYESFALVVERNGFTPVAYGSASTVNGNLADATWLAAWNDQPVVPVGAHGHQYLADEPWEGTQVDYSVFDAWLFARGGVGPRKGT
jgi:hypothetical protein